MFIEFVSFNHLVNVHKMRQKMTLSFIYIVSWDLVFKLLHFALFRVDADFEIKFVKMCSINIFN